MFERCIPSSTEGNLEGGPDVVGEASGDEDPKMVVISPIFIIGLLRPPLLPPIEFLRIPPLPRNRPPDRLLRRREEPEGGTPANFIDGGSRVIDSTTGDRYSTTVESRRSWVGERILTDYWGLAL